MLKNLTKPPKGYLYKWGGVLVIVGVLQKVERCTHLYKWVYLVTIQQIPTSEVPKGYFKQKMNRVKREVAPSVEAGPSCV
ncbi:hypothetical protein ATO12_15700 [Aquimarina atlantica]|uniref:Uncharacterized protein n=1 Tax=Aquimarina atlantica TaxID=1317122 RepID=A0A023BTW5_9FLAO|nr:hypothetical protein ATO12_15700 [Aquimarina atlantica]